MATWQMGKGSGAKMAKTEPQQSFKLGEVVTLKSGGPEMTVEEHVIVPHAPIAYKCQWFEGKKLKSGIFPGASFETPKPPTYG